MTVAPALDAPLQEGIPRQRRLRDVLEFLAVGGATLLLLPLGWGLQRWVGLDTAEFVASFVGFHLAFVINDPHFSATYLLFYRGFWRKLSGPEFPPAQRFRYWVAGIAVPAGLLAWAAVALTMASPESLGVMIQLMFLLVGWHYVKQGFGVLVVLSARRGVSLTLLERRVVLAHCLAGWFYAACSPAQESHLQEEKGVIYTAWPHPPALEAATALMFWLSAVALGAVLVWRLRRGAPMIPLAPLAGLLSAVWLWTVFSSVDSVLWYLIPALHSVQYLYFVGLLQRGEARSRSGPPSFESIGWRLGVFTASSLALGWLLFRGAPDALDGMFAAATVGDPSRSGLGPTPYLASLATIVNVHHYVMDSVIWRRDNRETTFLFD